MRRPKHAMPADIGTALRDSDVAADYRARPAYQQNDYIGWIDRAKLPATRTKRIRQMIAELRCGGIYMNMPHKPSAKTARAGKP